MRVHSFVDEGLGHSSYLVDLGNSTAALIDPPRFPMEHEQLAVALDLVIIWTIDTHSHADYITGSPVVAARHQAVFIAPGASRLAVPHHPVNDGEQVQMAPHVTLIAIATPGHTPDHHAYLLEEDGVATALFTGGSLMVGTVGRTDLCGPEMAKPLAHEMFHALQRFNALPNDLAVYPTHGAGSFCSAPGTTERTTTLGHERSSNTLFGVTDENDFVDLLVAGFGTFPSYFSRLPEINRLGPARYDTVPGLRTLTLGDVELAVARGAVIVDGRPLHRFATRHLAGSIANTLRPVFASWVGWLVDPHRPIVVVLDDDQSPAEAVRQCLDIGHEHFVGVLPGAAVDQQPAALLLASINLVDPASLETIVIDVRQANEYATGHLPGAINIELGQIASRNIESLSISVMCGHGERAMTAASILVSRGHHVTVLDGGPETWATATQRSLTVD